MHILPPTVRDADALTDLHLDVWEETYSDLVPAEVLAERRRTRRERVDRWREIIAGPESTELLAWEDGRLLGFVSSGPGRDAASSLPALEVRALYVRSAVYGRGVGHALLNAGIGSAPAFLARAIRAKCPTRHPPGRTLRAMGMTGLRRLAVVAATVPGLLLGACAGEAGEGGGGCESSYEIIAAAPTWQGLQAAMVSHEEHGPVESLRVQARGDDVGAGDQQAVRVVDLLDRDGRRLVQVDVWRTDAGAWRSGVWNQCID